MKIFLVRHGIKEMTPGDPPLSSIGRIQAHNTGLHLKKYEISKVLASPLLRTRQTAELICKEIGLSYEIDDKLRERMNWGDEPGQSLEDFLKEWTKTTIDRDYIASTGDSSRKTGQRLENIIKEQSSSQENKNIVLVTHGGIIVDFLRNVFSKKELNTIYERFSDSNKGTINECSITIIEYTNGKFELESFATIDHLAEKKST